MTQITGSDRKMIPLSFAAVAATMISGIIHLSLVHPFHGQIQNIGIFFFFTGVTQIFWMIPVVRRWHKTWHYIGIGGTGVLIAIWVLSRTSSLITSRPFPINPMGILEESMQVAFIVLLAAIIFYNGRINLAISNSRTNTWNTRTRLLIAAGIVIAAILVGLFVPISFGQPMGPPHPVGSAGQFGGPPP